MKYSYYFLFILSGLWLLNNDGYAHLNSPSVSNEWHIYNNNRFHYQLCYPSFMIPQGEADNGDGQIFVAEDGANIRVYGSYSLSSIYHNNFLKNIAEISQSILDDHGRVTYRADHHQWTVISGFDKNGKIFYMRSIKGKEGQIIVVLLTYSLQLKSVYDQLSQKISACFKATD